MNIIVVLLIIILLYCFIMLIRNNIVYLIRTRFIDLNYDYYKKLPSYVKMLFIYWNKWTYRSWVRWCNKH